MRTSVTRSSLWRQFELAMIVVAPVLAVLGSGLEAKDTDNSALAVARFAAHRDRYYIGGMLFALGMLMFLPAAHAMRGLFGSRGERAGAISRGAIVVGGLSMAFATALLTTVSWIVTGHDVTRSQAAAVIHAGNNSASAGMFWMVGMLLFLGFLGLAGSLLYARTVPWWQPALLIVGGVCVFAAGDGPINFLLGIPIVVAFASLLWTLVRRQSSSESTDSPLDLTVEVPVQPSGIESGTPTPA